MFPQPTKIATVPCARCRTPTRVDRLIAGAYGIECGARLGLIVVHPRAVRSEQSGPDLLTMLDEQDECEGSDHPAG